MHHVLFWLVQAKFGKSLAATSIDRIAYAQYHYNPRRDVVVRGEFMSEMQTKVGPPSWNFE